MDGKIMSQDIQGRQMIFHFLVSLSSGFIIITQFSLEG